MNFRYLEPQFNPKKETSMKRQLRSVTTKDREGREFISIIEEVYNQACLSKEEALRINYFQHVNKVAPELIRKIIDEYRHPRLAFLKTIKVRGSYNTGITKFTNNFLQEVANISHQINCIGICKKDLLSVREKCVKDATLRVYDVQRENCLDYLIFLELGEKTHITMTHLVNLVKKQSQGQKGILLVNGWNMAFIRNRKGETIKVIVNWLNGEGRRPSYWLMWEEEVLENISRSLPVRVFSASKS